MNRPGKLNSRIPDIDHISDLNTILFIVIISLVLQIKLQKTLETDALVSFVLFLSLFKKK